MTIVVFIYLVKMGGYMEIDIDSLKVEVNKLNKLIQDYEQNYLNLYNELSSASFFWKDKNVFNFSDRLVKEKLEVSTTFYELNNIKDIYDLVVLKYQKFGTKIRFDLSMKDSVFTMFDNYLVILDEVINGYINLDLSFCIGTVEADLILNEQKTLVYVKSNLLKLRDRIKNTFINIESIENDVNLQLSRVKLNVIKEDQVTEFI